MSEASILIFTYYWAPLLTSVFTNSMQVATASSVTTATLMDNMHDADRGQEVVSSSSAAIAPANVVTSSRYLLEGDSVFGDANIPYVLIYATFIMSTMLGKLF